MNRSEALRLISRELTYNPEAGTFTWLPRPHGSIRAASFNKKYAGKLAGSISNSYRLIIYRRKQSVAAHRLAWFMFYGSEPDGQIDHINGNKSDNRIANLRVVDAKGNGRNRPLRSDNKTGVNGVYPTRFNTWYAQACIDGRNRHLGTFPTYEEAVAARLASQAAIGFHPNHGRAQA